MRSPDGSRSSGPAALEFLFRIYYERTFRAAFMIAHDRSLAEDAVQEAFLQAFRKIDQLRDPQKVGAWLAVIAMNQAKRLLKQGACSVPMGTGEPPSPPAADEITATESRIVVGQLVRNLEPDDRQILVLKYCSELRDGEIAALLGIPSGTVKSRLNRVRARCRRMLTGPPLAPVHSAGRLSQGSVIRRRTGDAASGRF